MCKPLPKEDFLSYLWKNQNFNIRDLKTTGGLPLKILHPGNLNNAAGPDFSSARLRIGNQDFAGDVELHVQEHDWAAHGHSDNPQFARTILHVVWKSSPKAPAPTAMGRTLHTLELAPYVPEKLWENYLHFLETEQFIPCESFWETVPQEVVQKALTEALEKRLRRKTEELLALYERFGRDWEQATFAAVLRLLGMPKNTETFEALAKNLPLRILQKHNRPPQTEALLLGMAGLLPEATENPYALQLKREFSFLQEKFNLQGTLKKESWQFGRIRPAAQPLFRLVRVAAWVRAWPQWHGQFLKARNLKDLEAFFTVPPEPFWETHFSFEKPMPKSVNFPGKNFLQTSLINLLVPLQIAQGLQRKHDVPFRIARELLENCPAEQNSIVRDFRKLGFRLKKAKDTQAALGLYKRSCMKKRCLECPVGEYILKAKD